MTLSFKQKIMYGFMAVGLLPVLLYGAMIAYMSYQTGLEQAGNTMETIEEGYAQRLEHYFLTVHAQTRTMGANNATRDALRNFRAAVKGFDASTVEVDMAKLRARYQYQAEKTKGAKPSDAEAWMPKDPLTVALQHLYISGNSHPIGEKQNLEKADDNSVYSMMHGRYHAAFKNFIEEFGYYDLFIVDAETGYVIYSVFKEIDYMVSVHEGPLKNTGLMTLARDLLTRTDDEVSVMTDFAEYMPSYNDWAAFVGVPIVENGKTVGAFILQAPVGVLNGMFEKLKGFGATGEGFIVSKDGRYRTIPVRDDGKNIGDEIPQGMKDVVADAFAGKKRELTLWPNREGVEYVGAVERLHVPAENGHGDHAGTGKMLEWAVMIGQSKAEVLTNVMSQIWIGLGVLAAIGVLTSLLGMWAGNTLVKPVVDLANTFAASSKQVTASTGQVVEAVSGLVAASEETSAQSKVIRQNSSEAAGYVKSVASAVGELNVSINDISQSIGEVNSLVDDAVSKAQRTDEVVRNLGEAAGKISDVVNLINGLAEQTNLLALNAAIEAARAGDAGRGFAVVADEVKKLATHTSNATVEIGDQIKSIQDVSEQSVRALQGVVEAIHRIRDSATTVSAAVEEQSGVAKQIAGSVDDAAARVQEVDSNMDGIEQATSDTSVAANQVSDSANQVKSAFQNLDTEVGHVLVTMGVRKG